MGEATWAPTPGAHTLGRMQKSIAGFVLMPTDPEVVECALDGICDAIDQLNVRLWRWALTYDDIPFTVDTTDYPLTSWFKAPHHFEVWNESDETTGRFRFKEWKTFLMEHQSSVGSGSPSFYTVPNADALGTVTFDMKPTADWVTKNPNGRLWYFRRVQYPTGSGSAIDVPSEVGKFIRESACGFVADRYAVAKAQAAHQRAERFLEKLIADDNNTQTDWE